MCFCRLMICIYEKYRYYLPKHYAITDRLEEIICFWIHWDHVFTVRVLLKSFVNPVDEGILFFLCGHTIKSISLLLHLHHHFAFKGGTHGEKTLLNLNVTNYRTSTREEGSEETGNRHEVVKLMKGSRRMYRVTDHSC